MSTETRKVVGNRNRWFRTTRRKHYEERTEEVTCEHGDSVRELRRVVEVGVDVGRSNRRSYNKILTTIGLINFTLKSRIEP